ncbi:MAG: lipid II flippase MurJ [Bacteroidota bacterium]
MIDSLRSRLNTVNAFQFFQLFRYGSAILISILLANSYLTATDIAHYEWLLYIGTAVSFFWVNAFLQALLPRYPKYSAKEQKAFLFTVFLFFCGLSLLIFLLLYFGRAGLLPLLTGRTELLYFDYFLWFLLFNLPTGLVEYTYLLQKRSGWILIFGACSFGAYALAVCLPVWLGYSLERSIQWMVGVALGRFLWLLVLIFRQASFGWRTDLLRPYLVLAWPLVAYAVLGGIAQLFDQWLVGRVYAEDRLFAIFRYGARELPIAMALVSGLSAAMVPVVSEQLEEGLVQIREKSRRLFHWLFPLSIGLMLTSHWFFPALLSEEFAESVPIFNIYLLLLISRVLLPSTVILGLQKTKVILAVSIGEVLINILLSLYLVHDFGLSGIAIATVFAFLFEKLALAFYLYQRWGIVPTRYVDFRWYGSYVLLLLLAYIWTISGFSI